MNSAGRKSLGWREKKRGKRPSLSYNFKWRRGGREKERDGRKSETERFLEREIE